ncbi:hypothetical protein VTK56DRAFT_8348 [Thermocarpiscus australiensis]
MPKHFVQPRCTVPGSQSLRSTGRELGHTGPSPGCPSGNWEIRSVLHEDRYLSESTEGGTFTLPPPPPKEEKLHRRCSSPPLDENRDGTRDGKMDCRLYNPGVTRLHAPARGPVPRVCWRKGGEETHNGRHVLLFVRPKPTQPRSRHRYQEGDPAVSGVGLTNRNSEAGPMGFPSSGEQPNPIRGYWRFAELGALENRK